MIVNNWFKIWQLAICLVIFVLCPQMVGAQESFVVRPAIIETIIKPGESQIKTIEVVNNLGRTVEFMVEAEDVGSGDISAPLVLLGSSIGPYSLKNYLSWSQNSFRLADGEKYSLSFKISIPETEPPRSLHGAILISAKPLDYGLAPVISRIGSVLFVKIDGQINESGQVSKFILKNKMLSFLPAQPDFDITFINEGNIYLNPYGLIKIKNIFGQVKEEIILPPAFVLPHSQRIRTVYGLEKYHLGRYQAVLYLNRGYEKYSAVDNFSISFWSWPMSDIIMGLIFLAVIGQYFMFKKYKKWQRR